MNSGRELVERKGSDPEGSYVEGRGNPIDEENSPLPFPLLQEREFSFLP